MERENRFLISEGIDQTYQYHLSGDYKNAFNFASLVLWRVDRHQSWLTEAETLFIDSCLKAKPKRRAQ
jgi:predicted S18 family serine protease